MFREITAVVVLIVAMFAFAAAKGVGTYPSTYDFIDIDAILANDRNRNQYYNCFYGTSPCHTADAKFFKEFIAEALLTNCKKCTEKQVVMIDKLANWYAANEHEKWDAIVGKFVEDTKRKNKKA